MYAAWEFTIIFDRGHCPYASMPSDISVAGLSRDVTFELPRDMTENWTFIGYRFEDDGEGTVRYRGGDTASISGRTVLTAVWSVPVTVSDERNCRIETPVTAVAGMSWSMDVIPSLGYEVSQVTVTMGGAEIGTSADAVTGPITCSAKASPVEYRAELVTAYGTVGDGWSVTDGIFGRPFTVESETIQLPVPESDERFHSFTGWFSQDGSEISEIPSGTVGDVVYSALWTSRPYSLKMVVNGDIVAGSFTVDTSIPEPEAERGFRFSGWYYNDEEGETQRFESMTQMYDGMYLFAEFEPVPDEPVEMISYAIALSAVFIGTMCLAFRRKV